VLEAVKVSLPVGDNTVRFLGMGRGSQVVRHGSAKAVCVGSIPTPASSYKPLIGKGFVRVESQSFTGIFTCLAARSEIGLCSFD
jgi:hypothetical protein